MAPLIRFMLLIAVAAVSTKSQELSAEYYNATCPRATEIVRDVVSKAIKRHDKVGPALLRLFQVDCFVNGCDGSVLLRKGKHIESEKKAYPNRKSLKGFKVVDRIKKKLEKACPGLVSCADILAFAARDAVIHFGGPTWRVHVGRKDSTTASRSDADTFIPRPNYDLSALISSFSRVGLSPRDMVALSGAHTIGRARCRSYSQRAYYDSNIDGSFADALRHHCKRKGRGKHRDLDYSTPTNFDNAYFKNLLDRKGLLHSDQQLYSGGSVDSIVREYAADNDAFFRDFAHAMVKMGNIRGPHGNHGEVRKHCRKVNKHKHKD